MEPDGGRLRQDARPGRSERDRQWLEARRRRAAEMFRRGRTQADVARALHVSAQSVHRWYGDWTRGGMRSLRRAERTGRPPKLKAAQLKKVERALLKGPVANGYQTDIWTLERMAEVIRRVTGVSYHPGHVWKVLRTMGWSLQRPARRAAERDEEAVTRWAKCRWPRIKGGLQDAGPGSSSKTSRASR